MMRKLIDFECILPPDENGMPRQFQESASHRIGYGDPELLEALPGYGFGNYVNIFTKRQAVNISAQGKPAGLSLKYFVSELDREGVEILVLGWVHNHLLADVVAAYPAHFFHWPRSSILCGSAGFVACALPHSTIRQAPPVTTRSMPNAWTSMCPCVPTPP